MKTVILAGGLGTRLSEETSVRPKPMVEIGSHPMLWHLLSIYARSGFDDFVIALGYKGDIIKEYFRSFYALNSDFTVDLSNGEVHVHSRKRPNWRVHLVDTGPKTQTGGRIARLRELIGHERFLCTYGDGLAAIDIRDVLAAHDRGKRLATLTAVRPPARFGGLELEGDRVSQFVEKPQSGEGWINGGFFVFEPEIFDLLVGDESILEHEPLTHLAKSGQLTVFRHEGFWQPMDTLRDKRHLEELWASGHAPWA